MHITLKRLMVWVVMTANLTYVFVEPFSPENNAVDYLVGSAVFAVTVMAAKRHPIGYFVLGVLLLNFQAYIVICGALYVSVWGGMLGCFIGCLAGWDAMSKGQDKAAVAGNELED